MVALIQYDYVLVEGTMVHKDNVYRTTAHVDGNRNQVDVHKPRSGRGWEGELPKSRGQPWNRFSLVILGIFSVSLVMPPFVCNIINLALLSQSFS